jgi:hypothetical protein
MGTHHRKHMSRDHYLLLCDVTADTENSFLYGCVLDCVYRAVAWQHVDQTRYNNSDILLWINIMLKSMAPTIPSISNGKPYKYLLIIKGYFKNLFQINSAPVLQKKMKFLVKNTVNVLPAKAVTKMFFFNYLNVSNFISPHPQLFSRSPCWCHQNLCLLN